MSFVTKLVNYIVIFILAWRLAKIMREKIYSLLCSTYCMSSLSQTVNILRGFTAIFEKIISKSTSANDENFDS